MRLALQSLIGIDRDRATAYYKVHVAPIVAEDGSIPYVVEMSTDVTETVKLKDEAGNLTVKSLDVRVRNP